MPAYWILAASGSCCSLSLPQRAHSLFEIPMDFSAGPGASGGQQQQLDPQQVKNKDHTLLLLSTKKSARFPALFPAIPGE
jgi:hypothetical protein